jgi:hypothetical protein
MAGRAGGGAGERWGGGRWGASGGAEGGGAGERWGGGRWGASGERWGGGRVRYRRPGYGEALADGLGLALGVAAFLPVAAGVGLGGANVE